MFYEFAKRSLTIGILALALAVPAAASERDGAASSPSGEAEISAVGIETTAEDENEMNETEIMLNGRILSLPFPYAEISDKWILPEDHEYARGKIIPDKTTPTASPAVSDAESGAVMNATIANLSEDDKEAPDCDVIGLNARMAKDGEASPDLFLKGGVTWGSSKDDVEKALGKPKGRSVEADGTEDLSYEFGNGLKMNLTVSDAEGLTGIMLYNKQAPESETEAE